MRRADQVTKELIKSEIDKVQDEYLGALLTIVKAFEVTAPQADTASKGLAEAPGSDTRRWTREALAEIRSSKLTSEETKILEEFDAFRREHPLRLVSLDEER
jgi:hypothetical protein